MDRRRKHRLWLVTLLAFTLLSIATATSTGKSDPAKQHEAGKAQEAGYVSAEVEIPQVAPQIDEKQPYVDKALDILRKLDPSPTRYRKGRSAAGLDLGGTSAEAPRGLVGTTFYYLKQIFSIVLFHNPVSLEEPLEGATLARGNIKDGRHARQLKTAVEALEVAAQADNSDAIYLLGQMNFYGNWSHPRNYRTAFDMFKKLADKNGNSTAQYMVGFLYATGFGGVERDQGKALLYHSFAGLNGNLRSEMTVAFRHHTGIGTPRNCESAAYHYKRVADKAMEYWRAGPPGGRYTVRYSYRIAEDEGGVYGEETAENMDDILEYWDFMAGKGNLLATYTLGKMYYEGSRNMPRNIPKARAYFLSLVNRYWLPNGKIATNFPLGTEKYAAKSAGQLGKMYLRGDGVPQSYEQAMMWFEKGSSRGDYCSQNGIGFMYLNGLGKPRDLDKAAEYFDAAASQDFAPAQVNLGKILLEQGDYADAKRYFELAARHGNVESYYYLAEIFNSGKERERSCSMATAYYKIVAERIEAVHSNIEWANKAYADGDYETAVIGYLMAAEQGYEAAQQNVAYILDDQRSRLPLKKIPEIIYNKLFAKPLIGSGSQHQESALQKEEATKFRNREMALIYWTRSAKQSNPDSLVKMGDYYLSGIGTEEDKEKAAACYQAASEYQQGGQALWDLGWMYENGLGVEQDFHLAKRFYDQALETNPNEAYLPIKLSLLKLQVRSFWNRITGGGVNDVGAETVPQPPKKPWSFRDFLARWNAEVDAANAAAAAAQAAADAAEAAEHVIPPADSDHVHDAGMLYDDDELRAAEDMVESALILVLATAVVLLIWYRHQRQVQVQNGAGGGGNNNGGGVGGNGDGGGGGMGMAGFPEPGGAMFGMPPLP